MKTENTRKQRFLEFKDNRTTVGSIYSNLTLKLMQTNSFKVISDHNGITIHIPFFYERKKAVVRTAF